jgi:hypothetical protein
MQNLVVGVAVLNQFLNWFKSANHETVVQLLKSAEGDRSLPQPLFFIVFCFFIVSRPELF